eukprot:3385763-Prymnesium_polylepis.2
MVPAPHAHLGAAARLGREHAVDEEGVHVLRGAARVRQHDDGAALLQPRVHNLERVEIAVDHDRYARLPHSLGVDVVAHLRRAASRVVTAAIRHPFAAVQPLLSRCSAAGHTGGAAASICRVRRVSPRRSVRAPPRTSSSRHAQRSRPRR